MRSALFVLILIISAIASADEKLPGIACRSVHLGYQADAGTAFAVEATVRQSAPGTYFCAIGFHAGYFGIQELADGKKLVLFSVWDPTEGDDKNAVPEEQRVKLLYKDDAVRVGRFGGEGTGGQSFFDYDWKIGETYRFVVTTAPDPAATDRMTYTGAFYLPETKAWKKLVTFSTVSKRKQLSGFYSFVEDFRRNRDSAKRTRIAEYGPACVRNDRHEWHAVTAARFTADSNSALTIDAGANESGERFFLATGGDTTNTTTQLKEVITLKASPGPAPTGLPTE